jgi:putative hydrolase of the HAD superfamily
VAVEAVLFDWGGTLTPWRTITPRDEWASLAAVAVPDRHEEATHALAAAADQVWARSREEHRSSTIEEICRIAGVPYDEEHLGSYRAFWEPATVTDADVPEVLGWLRGEGIKVGVLSNTVWPGAWHEDIFVRDGIDELIDGAVYTSEIAWTKPAPQAFLAAMEAVGVAAPERCVFVGDRLFDDIYGAKNVGMKAVLVPHSEIPSGQVGHTLGEPDAVIHSLADLPGVIDAWR